MLGEPAATVRTVSLRASVRLLLSIAAHPRSRPLLGPPVRLRQMQRTVAR